jgi:DNA-binding transcriptional ArsR family regulator
MQRQKARLEGKIDTEKLFLAAQPLVAVKILDEVRKLGRATMGELVTATGVSRSTLRDHLRGLVERRQLMRYGLGKGSWYTSP